MLSRTLLALLVFAAAALAGEPAQVNVEDFAFIQISDIHIGPHLMRTGAPGPLNGAESVAWICREAAQPQNVSEIGLATPVPAFGLVTGDLTEYGVIDDTWSLFEQAFAALPYRLYVLPGNHDNTWVAMYHVMRQRYGGENYSFDKFGCHFACICSASPQEPLPSIDAKTRTWFKHDLEQLAPQTPVFLALHHPPDSTEFANPAEYDTLMDLLRDYNVALILVGHGHAVQSRSLDGIDCVMGGSTFGKNAGYSIISVQAGKLRVAYHYLHMPAADKQDTSEPGWTVLLEKPLSACAPPRLFQIATPRAGDAIGKPQFDLTLTPAADGVEPAELTVQIDGHKTAAEPDGERGRFVQRVTAGELTPGWHLLSVRVQTKDGARDLRTTPFIAGDSAQPWVWRAVFPAAVKAGPVVAGDKLIAARTDGVVSALELGTGKSLWTFQTGGEILGTPAWSDPLAVFGSDDGKVYAIDGTGQSCWTFEAGAPVYGSPLIDGDTVFVGDNGGRLHALELKSGTLRWTFSRADFSIECQPCRWGERIVFGAWDGYLYALRRTDGGLEWKVPGPKSSDGQAPRYYAPADCGSVALGETLFVCDRGYLLGTFNADGTAGRLVDKSVSAIALDLSRKYVFARTTDGRVCKYDAAGAKVWEQRVPAGRFPVPPTCRENAVYVCSNTGLLSVVNPADGALRGSFQVTPGFYVMAPVAEDGQGTCYVAGMDGTVTALRIVAH
jgi:outer membrane protein assembly factor BamB